MKKFFLSAALVAASFLGVNSVMAQTAQTTDNVNLQLVLHPIQSITVATAQKTVKLEYKTLDDYKNTTGNNSLFEAGHLNVFSTNGFNIKVRSSDFDDQATEKPGIGTISLQAKYGQTSQDAIALAASDKVLFTSSDAQDIAIDVTYSGATVNAYLNNKYFKKGSSDGAPETTTYTATVTYSIEAL